jgi:hypothetical protein
MQSMPFSPSWSHITTSRDHNTHFSLKVARHRQIV